MKQILIVEDDAGIAALQKDYLAAMSDFEADTVGSGTEALDMAGRKSYDLVILDLMLPGMDGYEVLRRLRQRTDIPVIIVSARKDEIDKIRGLGLGADDYMTKPFSPGELVARVKAHVARYDRLKNAGEPPGPTLRAGGLEIHTDAMRVFHGEKELALTQKEYELLLLFVRHPDRVFGREELFERVWGLDALGDASTVTVHIARLREKIGVRGDGTASGAGTPYIETVWGAGYRFRS